MRPSVKLDAAVITSQMCLRSPVDLPLVAAQLRVIIKVLVARFAVKLRVHGVLLVVVTVVKGYA